MPSPSTSATASSRPVANGPIYFTNGRVNRVDVDGVSTLQDPAEATDLAWSPDGSRFASVGGRPNGPIHVTQRDGSRSVELTQGFAPAWSPNSSSIAFVRMSDINDGTRSEILLINADGSGERDLTNTPDLREAFPSWSPDGARVLFTRWATDGTENVLGYLPEIVEVHVHTGHTAVVGRGQQAISSPDGKWIAVSNCPGIAILGAEAHDDIHVIRDAACVMPAWSPDGLLAYALRDHVAILDPATAHVTELSVHPDTMFVVEVAWSPDGLEVASVVTVPCAECYEGGQRGGLVVQAASEGADPRRIPDADPSGGLAWPPAEP